MSSHLFFLFAHRIFKSKTYGIADENTEMNDTYSTAYLSPQLMIIVEWHHYGANKQFRGLPTYKQWRSKERKVFNLGIQLCLAEVKQMRRLLFLKAHIIFSLFTHKKQHWKKAILPGWVNSSTVYSFGDQGYCHYQQEKLIFKRKFNNLNYSEELII